MKKAALITTLAAGGALAMSVATQHPAIADDCMRDGSGNFWGDCSNGYDPNGTYTVDVYAAAPPSTLETLFNVVTNWTGPIGSAISTFNALVQYAGGWDAIGQNYYDACTASPYACMGPY